MFVQGKMPDVATTQVLRPHRYAAFGCLRPPSRGSTSGKTQGSAPRPGLPQLRTRHRSNRNSVHPATAQRPRAGVCVNEVGVCDSAQTPERSKLPAPVRLFFEQLP